MDSVSTYLNFILFYNCSNPLNRKSDQYQISPCHMNGVVMRIKDRITQDEFA